MTIIDAFVPSWTMFPEQLPDSGYQMVIDGDDKMTKGEQEWHHSKLFCLYQSVVPSPISLTHTCTQLEHNIKHTLLTGGL